MCPNGLRGGTSTYLCWSRRSIKNGWRFISECQSGTITSRARTKASSACCAIVEFLLKSFALRDEGSLVSRLGVD